MLTEARFKYRTDTIKVDRGIQFLHSEAITLLYTAIAVSKTYRFAV